MVSRMPHATISTSVAADHWPCQYNSITPYGDESTSCHSPECVERRPELLLISQVRQLLNAGVNVGMGVDGSASNDCGSLLAETRLAFMLQRAQGTIEGVRSPPCVACMSHASPDFDAHHLQAICLGVQRLVCCSITCGFANPLPCVKRQQWIVCTPRQAASRQGKRCGWRRSAVPGTWGGMTLVPLRQVPLVAFPCFELCTSQGQEVFATAVAVTSCTARSSPGLS